MNDKYPSQDGWKKDGSYACWDKYEYVHFDYRPSGIDGYMGSTIKGFNIGVCSNPVPHIKEQMPAIIHKIVAEMGNDFKAEDITYVGTYPFNDEYGRISSDVWVARLINENS